MTSQPFDRVVHALGRGASRRRVLGVLVGITGLGVSAVQAARPQKVGICHLNPDGTYSFMRVIFKGEDDRRQLNRHLAHGDFLGQSQAECDGLT